MADLINLHNLPPDDPIVVGDRIVQQLKETPSFPWGLFYGTGSERALELAQRSRALAAEALGVELDLVGARGSELSNGDFLLEWEVRVAGGTFDIVPDEGQVERIEELFGGSDVEIVTNAASIAAVLSAASSQAQFNVASSLQSGFVQAGAGTGVFVVSEGRKMLGGLGEGARDVAKFAIVVSGLVVLLFLGVKGVTR